MKAVTSRVIWVGNAAELSVGPAVIPALTVGLAPTALAGTGVGARTKVANCLDFAPTR